VPVVGAALAEMSSAYGVEVPEDLFVKVLLTTGEICSDSVRNLLTETWQSAVYNFNYGSQEAGAAAVARPDAHAAVQRRRGNWSCAFPTADMRSRLRRR
jgi:phenylacetate-coenzyme A ligase PaaK-like adenylate-forming protein